MNRIFHYQITENEQGTTVLDFLRKKGFSRHILSSMKADKEALTRNGQRIGGREQLLAGDHFRVRLLETVDSDGIVPVSMPLSILYEDEDILVINKPADMPVHPSIGNYTNTLANGVAAYLDAKDEHSPFRCINRLDRDTSGTLILAKNAFSLERSMDEGTSGIECDNYQGGVLATELLIEKGCRKLMFIGGVSAGVDIHMPGDLREVAFRDICKNRNEENVVMVTDNRLFDSLEYYEYVRQALVDNPEVDGVFASSDVIGAYVLQACADLGIKVPEQLKIVGFDDVNIAQFTSPGLTTIHQPVEQMAEMAVAAIAQIDEGKMVPTKAVFPVTLVERGTT